MQTNINQGSFANAFEDIFRNPKYLENLEQGSKNISMYIL